MNIIDIIKEMCLYWSIPRAHELKTRLHMRKLIPLESEAIASITPNQLIFFYNSLRANSDGTDESVKRMYGYVARVFEFAFERQYIQRNPCNLLRLPKSRKADIKHLTAAQLAQLETLPLATALARVRDMFLFQCYTGLAIKDLRSFGLHSVVTIEGRQYISGARGKTGTEYVVPLFDGAKALAEQYNYCFSFLCAQKYNEKLKTIQAAANISLNLTSHVGRRTFGQLSLDKGIPIEVVSRMLGHSSISVTEKYYARVTIRRILHQFTQAAA